MNQPITEAVLLAAVVIAAIVVALRSPFTAFCVLIVTLPFESALAIRTGVTITPAYLALILALAQIGRWLRVFQIDSIAAPASRFVIAYLVAAALSLVMTALVVPPRIVAESDLLGWRVSEYRSLVQFAFLCFSASAFFVTLLVCSTPARLRFIVRLFIVVSAVTALYGLFQMVAVWYRAPLIGAYARGQYETPASLRPNATFQEAMNLGHFLVAGLGVLISLHLHARDSNTPERFVYGPVAVPMIATMVVALLLTIGRGAWLGFAVECLVILVASNRLVRARALALASVSAAVAVAFALFTFGSLDVLVATVVNRFQFDSAALSVEQRTWYFPFLMSLVREYPILGVGYGNYPIYQVFAFGLWGIAGAYGVFWQALVETGIVGFATLVAMIAASVGSIAKTLTRTQRPEWRPYLVGWLAAICGLSTSYLFFGDRFSLYMWVVLGLAMATVREARKPLEPA